MSLFTPPRTNDRATHRRLALCAALASLVSCIGDNVSVTEIETCGPTSRYPGAIGCAYVFGKITDTRGLALDSIEGSVRPSDECACSAPRIEGDDNGVFSVLVHRLARPQGFVDTATVTLVVLASAPKYPRHVTGAAYFDTMRVAIRFARNGAVPPPFEANLRIPIPFK